MFGAEHFRKDISQQSSAVLAKNSQSVLAQSAFDAQTLRTQRDSQSIRSSTQTNDDHLELEMYKGWDAELDVDDEIVRSGPYLAHFRSLMEDGSNPSNSQEMTSSFPQASDNNRASEEQIGELESETSPLGRRSKLRTSVLSEFFGDRSIATSVLIWGFVLDFSIHPLRSIGFRQRALQGLILSTSLVGCALVLPKSYTWDRSAESRQLVEQLCRASSDGDHAWISDLLDRGAYINGFVSY